MKKFYFILLLSLLSECVFAQDSNPPAAKSRYSVLRYEVVVQEINFLSHDKDTTRLAFFDDVAFQKMQVIDTDYTMIKAVYRVKRHKKNAHGAVPPKMVEIGKYYLVKTDLLKDNTDDYTPQSWAVRAGVVSIPAKFYLPDDGNAFSFSSRSVSLGTTIGVARQTSRTKRNLWVNYLVGAQFTMVSPSQADFLNFNTSTTSDDSNTLSAFSLSLGLAFEFEGIEAGFFVGKDFLQGTAASRWKHNGDTWFSIGIGTNLSNGSQKLSYN